MDIAPGLCELRGPPADSFTLSVRVEEFELNEIRRGSLWQQELISTTGESSASWRRSLDLVAPEKKHDRTQNRHEYAAAVEFTLPSGGSLRLEADLPADLAAALRQAKRPHVWGFL